jgi:pSer/pThr/pTyr-binding forkhead associated (FHA) protein
MATQQEQNHLLIVEDDRGRKEFILKAPVYSIGRDATSDIRLASQFVSRRHATLVRLPRQDGTHYYRIVDGDAKGKGSSNGLLINGRRLTAHDLENEDEIVFGPQVRAKYFQLKRDTQPSGPLDPFDITLINPSMLDEDSED